MSTISLHTKIKKTRRVYTRNQKIEILKDLEISGENMGTYSLIKNIPYKTLHKWKQDKNNILLTNKKDLYKKRLNIGNKIKVDHNIEIQIMEWFLNVRSMGLPITDKLIKSRAKFLVKSNNLAINCNFSNGWLNKFKNRYKIGKRKAGSKIVRKDDCEIVEITTFIDSFNNEIKVGDYYSIINIDETGIYYDPMINSTLELKGTKRVEIKSTGREKQRITVVLGVDFLGNLKMKPLIILKGKTERCLTKILLDDSYILTYQKNSWCSENQFIKFLSCLPNDKKILLLYDNFRGHKTENVLNFLKNKLPLVKYMLLPPNTTSILQPLDVGINKPFKCYINEQYCEWLITYYDKYKILPKLSKMDRTNLLLKWIINSWEKINTNQHIIKNSFSWCGFNYTNIINVEPKWKKYYNLQ